MAVQYLIRTLLKPRFQYLFVEDENEEGFNFGEIIGIISVRDVIKNLPAQLGAVVKKEF